MSALEHRLAAWRPAVGGLDRDRMLYSAGWSAARADGHIHAWRLATAALLLVVIGFGGLLARQRSLLAREGDLLAHERTKRMALETTIAARAVPAEHSQPAGDPPPIEPFAPTSYFALVSRHSESIADLSRPDARSATESHRRDPGPVEGMPATAPLRSRDVTRVLDL